MQSLLRPAAVRPHRRTVRAAATPNNGDAPEPAKQPSIFERLFMGRRAAITAGVAAGVAASAGPGPARAAAKTGPKGPIPETDAEWKAALSPEAYRVLRKAGTERPGSSPLNNEKRAGTFVCGGCGTPLFDASAKYNSGTGWPSFFKAIDGAIVEELDKSIPFMPRTEVHCAVCGSHQGHVFPDGPPPTYRRYCINGVALEFVPKA